MANMQEYGFHFSHYRNGNKTPVRRKYTFKDTETLTKGDVLNLESGEVDLFATGGDTGAIGVADETVSGTDSTTEIWVILAYGDQAVWRVYDATARTEGAELDITGTTGAQTVGADGDSDLIVEATSTADQPTLVRFHPRATGWLDA
jgi:hypothetical protein